MVGYFVVYEAGKPRSPFNVPMGDFAIGTATCRLEIREGCPVLIDASASGTLTVNRAPLVEHALQQGDVVRVGDCSMVYHTPHPSTLIPNIVTGGLHSQPLTAATLRIGRDPRNEIVLLHPQVSRFHAIVTSSNGLSKIEDCRSSHGTFVNGVRLGVARTLLVNDFITIVDHTFIFDGSSLQYFSEEGNLRVDAMNLYRNVPGCCILNDVSLSIQSRELVAVVGGSGAGKSTLINALAGFRKADSGVVLFNGQNYYERLDAFRSSIGYVPQDDIIHADLTAERALFHAARLRLPPDTSRQEIDASVDRVLLELQLEERRGIPVRQLSGGQRKRVSLGVELLTRPRLLFLDEPTSGLDPGMEKRMMRNFRALADAGHTVILITHATQSIDLCDRVAFMAQGGRLVFMGSPQEATTFFGTTDFAEIYLRVEADPEAWQQRFNGSVFHQSNVGKRLQGVRAFLSSSFDGSTGDAGAVVSEGGPARTSIVHQITCLVRRHVEVLWCDRSSAAILLLQAPLLAVFLLAVFHYQPGLLQPHPDADAMAAYSYAPPPAGKAKVLLFLLTFFSFICGTINSVREIVKEGSIYRRERAVNLRMLPYVFSKFIFLGGVSGLQTLTFLLVFVTVRPPPVQSFLGLVFAFLFLTNLCGVAIGLTLSALVATENAALFLLPVILLSQVVFAGILVPIEGRIAPVKSLTVLKWGFEGLASSSEVWKVFPTRTQVRALQCGIVRSGVADAEHKVAVVEAARDSWQEWQTLYSVPILDGLLALCFYVLLFIGLTCAFVRRRERLYG